MATATTTTTPPPDAAEANADQDAASFLATIPEEHRDAVALADSQVVVGDEGARQLQAQQIVANREAQAVAREQTISDLDAALEARPVAETTVYSLPPEQYRAREIVKIRRDAAESNLDTTVPGGKYTMADGSVRDAAGNVIEEPPEEG